MHSEEPLGSAIEDAERAARDHVEQIFGELRTRLESDFRKAVAEGVESALSARRQIPWGSLTPDQQDLNLRASRLARVKVAEMQLYKSEAVKKGRASANLYAALRSEIDAAREAFRQQFLISPAVSADYLHEELVRSLAHEDPRLLGPEYPGPLL